MLLAGFRKLKETLFVTAETVERQKLENELKLEELLNELREDDPPENETDLVTNDRASVSMNDVQWNCTKAEGFRFLFFHSFIVSYSHTQHCRSHHFVKRLGRLDQQNSSV